MNPHLVLQRMTTVQAAVWSHRHPKTILKALEAGTLHGSQRVAGGRWLIDPRCLDSWLDGDPCEHQS